MTSRFGGYELQEFISEFYDEVYGQRGPKDAGFYISYSKAINGRTLELGCGTGRVLIPTATSGCEITGLDLSAYMIAKCRQKLDTQPEEIHRRVRLLQGNMTGFDTGETYSLVTIPFRAFQHLLSVEEQKACLTCVDRHLSPGGRLIIDVFNPFPPRLVDDPKYASEKEDLFDTVLSDGRRLRTTSRVAGFHRNLQYNEIELIYYVTHRDGETERLVQSFPMRYLFRYEMEHLLELSGFKVVDLFGNYDGSTFSEDSPEMIFVAAKR